MKCDVSSCPEEATVLVVFDFGGRYPYCSGHAAPHVRLSRSDPGVSVYDIRGRTDG